MPNWNDILNEINEAGSTFDVVRRKYLRALSEHTGRNTIVYYSGWLQKEELARQGFLGFNLNDSDKNGFMATVCGLDRSKGLDLVLHTPGGDMAATESLVDYLRSMFGTNIRAIVPQIAMSAGTMIACASREIIMGKHSSLGPVDPQILGLPAHGIVEEFKKAADDISKNPATIPLWQPIIARYHPTLIGESQKAIKWADAMVKDWLQSGMFQHDADKSEKADHVISELGSHALTLSHARHISVRKASEMGLSVITLESDQDLQDAVLSVHHACIHTLTNTPAVKLVENQNGIASIQTIAHLTRGQ